MLGRTCFLILRRRSLSTCQHVLNTGSFQSQYNIEKLYPQSQHDITIPFRESHDEKAVQDNKFSGLIPTDKLTVKYSRSGGAGGQNVNKVETKVDVRFNLASADWLPENIRDKIQQQQMTKINNKGELIVTSQRTRSQIQNFSDCLQKIRDMVAEAERKPKEPNEKDKAVRRIRVEAKNRERLRVKKIHSDTKQDRRVSVDD